MFPSKLKERTILYVHNKVEDDSNGVTSYQNFPISGFYLTSLHVYLEGATEENKWMEIDDSYWEQEIILPFEGRLQG